MRFFVFVDMAYYPYVDDEIEADSLEEARAKAAESLRPGDDVTVYVVPAEAVSKVEMQGPRNQPKGIFALQEEMNELRTARMKGAMLGGFSIVIEPGSLS